MLLDTFTRTRPELETVTAALRHVRTSPGITEAQLHTRIAIAFDKAQLSHKHEVSLAPGCRIDFVVGDRIGVEVKRGKPCRAQVAAQLQRYAELGTLDAIVLCMDRCVLPVDGGVGIPYVFVSFNTLRGIAV